MILSDVNPGIADPSGNGVLHSPANGLSSTTIQMLRHRLSVVVPMYNERDNAVPMLDELASALANYPCPWELIIVDDGSTDGTARVLREHAKQLGAHVRVLCLTRNFRQTAAMQAGIDAARGDVVVTLDGDLQNDPHDIPRLVHRLLIDDLDLVAGWRRERQDGFVLRRLPSLLANRLIRRATGLMFQDLGCSLKAFRTDVLRRIRLYGEMHRFIPAWLATVTSPARMAEVVVSHRPRTRGTSKYGLSRTIRVLLDLLSMQFFLRFGARPGHFFGGAGLMVATVGMAILGWLAVEKFAFDQSIGSRPLLALGFVLLIGGLQLLTTGVLAELLIRIYFETGGASSYHLRDHSTPPDDEAWRQ